MRTIRTTYAVVSPESAAIGDYEDTGWHDEDGLEIAPDEDDIELYGDGDGFEAVVSMACDVITQNGRVEPSDYPSWQDGTWYTQSDPDIDYSTGHETRYSYHLDGFTDEESQAIYNRLT